VARQDDAAGIRGDTSACRLGDQPRQPVDRRGDVVERPRPAAAGLPGSSVFRRTNDDSSIRQSLGERPDVFPSVFSAPEPAMKKNCEQGSSASVLCYLGHHGRDMDIGDLVGVVAVAQYQVRGPGGPAQHVSPVRVYVT
jgi:hypothetical protein